jgi:alpha-L-fucosidase 2
MIRGRVRLRDRLILRDVSFPTLGKAVNYFIKFPVEGPDGRLHLPQTRSPEYANAVDCIYDLSLIRWACRALLAAAGRRNIADPWHSTVERRAGAPGAVPPGSGCPGS